MEFVVNVFDMRLHRVRRRIGFFSDALEAESALEEIEDTPFGWRQTLGGRWLAEEVGDVPHDAGPM